MHRQQFVVLVTQLCPTLCDTTDCSPPGSSIHGFLQARTLEWAAISSSRGSSRPRDGSHVSCLAGRFFTTEPPGKPQFYKQKHILMANRITPERNTAPCLSLLSIVTVTTAATDTVLGQAGQRSKLLTPINSQHVVSKVSLL